MVVPIGVLLTVAACSADNPSSPEDFGPAAYYISDEGGGMDALLTGTLTLEDGCLYVVDERGSEILPVFPSTKTSWADGELRLPSGTYAPGDTIRLGGGIAPGGLPEAILPETCRQTEHWIVADTP
ncbi:hypothetical protein GCM10027403_09140 [Arthrobacter tecti]